MPERPMVSTGSVEGWEDAFFHTIRLVAHHFHQPTLLEQQISVNHLRAYLLLFDGTSVEIDMRQVSGDGDGMLSIEHKNWQESQSRLLQHDVVLAEPKRVKDVIEIIYQGRLDNYMFSPLGSGCRYWQFLLLARLDSHEFFGTRSEALIDALLFITQRYSRAQPPVLHDIEMGTFGDAYFQAMHSNFWLLKQDWIQTKIVEYEDRMEQLNWSHERLLTEYDHTCNEVARQAIAAESKQVADQFEPVGVRHKYLLSLRDGMARTTARWAARR